MRIVFSNLCTLSSAPWKVPRKERPNYSRGFPAFALLIPGQTRWREIVARLRGFKISKWRVRLIVTVRTSGPQGRLTVESARDVYIAELSKYRRISEESAVIPSASGQKQVVSPSVLASAKCVRLGSGENTGIE